MQLNRLVVNTINRLATIRFLVRVERTLAETRPPAGLANEATEGDGAAQRQAQITLPFIALSATYKL